MSQNRNKACMVRDFMRKVTTWRTPVPLEPERLEVDDVYDVFLALRSALELARSTERTARRLGRGISMPMHRAMLIVEEASEVVEALCDGDLAHLAKELADLEYVTVGTAVTFGIDIDWTFALVHESNMTKGLGAVKGNDYADPMGAIRKEYERRNHAE